jgi:hypothetical protein
VNQPVQPGLKRNWRHACRRVRRPVSRQRHQFAARLRPGLRYWGRQENPARRLIFLVRQVLKFHESEYALMSGQFTDDN